MTSPSIRSHETLSDPLPSTRRSKKSRRASWILVAAGSSDNDDNEPAAAALDPNALPDERYGRGKRRRKSSISNPAGSPISADNARDKDSSNNSSPKGNQPKYAAGIADTQDCLVVRPSKKKGRIDSTKSMGSSGDTVQDCISEPKAQSEILLQTTHTTTTMVLGPPQLSSRSVASATQQPQLSATAQHASLTSSSDKEGAPLDSPLPLPRHLAVHDWTSSRRSSPRFRSSPGSSSHASPRPSPAPSDVASPSPQSLSDHPSSSRRTYSLRRRSTQSGESSDITATLCLSPGPSTSSPLSSAASTVRLTPRLADSGRASPDSDCNDSPSLGRLSLSSSSRNSPAVQTARDQEDLPSMLLLNSLELATVGISFETITRAFERNQTSVPLPFEPDDIVKEAPRRKRGRPRKSLLPKLPLPEVDRPGLAPSISHSTSDSSSPILPLTSITHTDHVDSPRPPSRRLLARQASLLASGTSRHFPLPSATLASSLSHETSVLSSASPPPPPSSLSSSSPSSPPRRSQRVRAKPSYVYELIASSSADEEGNESDRLDCIGDADDQVNGSSSGPSSPNLNDVSIRLGSSRTLRSGSSMGSLGLPLEPTMPSVSNRTRSSSKRGPSDVEVVEEEGQGKRKRGRPRKKQPEPEPESEEEEEEEEEVEEEEEEVDDIKVAVSCGLLMASISEEVGEEWCCVLDDVEENDVEGEDWREVWYEGLMRRRQEAMVWRLT